MERLEQIVSAFISRVEAVETEWVMLDKLLGRNIAQEIRSPFPWPPFNRSLRDGYALRSKETVEASITNPALFTVSQVLPAGSLASRTLQTAEAARILTGAQLPQGADAVVAFEEVGSIRGEQIAITAPVSPWQYVRRKGEVTEAGEVVISRGTNLGPAEIELLASVGQDKVLTYRQPIVTIIPVGSELLEPGEPMAPGKIYSSNGYLLAAWTSQWGGRPMRKPSISDDVTGIVTALKAAFHTSDILVTTGGASRGDFDFAPAVLAELGATSVERILPKQPGGPFVGGFVEDKPVLSFSGSPRAALRSAKIFLKPLLAKMQGNPKC